MTYLTSTITIHLVVFSLAFLLWKWGKRDSVRREKIEYIFRTYLDRSVDPIAMEHYFHSDMSIDEINDEVCYSRESLIIKYGEPA